MGGGSAGLVTVRGKAQAQGRRLVPQSSRTARPHYLRSIGLLLADREGAVVVDGCQHALRKRNATSILS